VALSSRSGVCGAIARALARGAAIARRLAAPALGVLLASACSAPPPPVLATLPELALVDQNGAPVTRATLAGRPFVADFVFTRCVAACPRLTARMRELATELPRGSRARLVSISVDPEHDRPEVLLEWARARGLDLDRWLLLTGERDEVWNLIRRGFLLPVEEQSDPGNPFLHSNRFALVDGAGRLRGTYEAFEEDAMERLLADLAAIEREPGA
jgi:protein SCO1/2